MKDRGEHKTPHEPRAAWLEGSEPWIDDRIAALDPLGADEFFRTDFTAFNEAANVGGLVDTASILTQRVNAQPELSQPEARAATRDLGFVASAIVRFGGSLDAVAGLEPALLSLTIRTDEVPRDTVFSYTTRNPTGDRERRFTESSQ